MMLWINNLERSTGYAINYQDTSKLNWTMSICNPHPNIEGKTPKNKYTNSQSGYFTTILLAQSKAIQKTNAMVAYNILFGEIVTLGKT